MLAPWKLWPLLYIASPQADPRALRDEARAAGLELEAARSGQFYLVVNLSASQDRPPERRPAQALLRLPVPAPLLPEIRPGEVVSVEPPPEPRPQPLSLACEPPLDIRFVSRSSRGLLTTLRNRFGGLGNRPMRVVVAIEDAGAVSLASMLPEKLRVLFSRPEAQ